MGRRKPVELIQGTATHRRTERDYMAVLLEAVTLDDWRTVVANTLQEAKGGNPQARNWLAQYLVGRPTSDAPTPLTVVVQQLSGSDPVVNKLAKPIIDQQKYPRMHGNEAQEDHIRALIAAELQQKIKTPEVLEDLAPVRVCGPKRLDSGGNG
jgi:hypothetical protein